EKPSGSIKCNCAPVLAHSRMILPVLGGISGSYSAICNMPRSIASERVARQPLAFVETVGIVQPDVADTKVALGLDQALVVVAVGWHAETVFATGFIAAHRSAILPATAVGGDVPVMGARLLAGKLAYRIALHIVEATAVVMLGAVLVVVPVVRFVGVPAPYGGFQATIERCQLVEADQVDAALQKFGDGLRGDRVTRVAEQGRQVGAVLVVTHQVLVEVLARETVGLAMRITTELRHVAGGETAQR